jgi:hypothetical protein
LKIPPFLAIRAVHASLVALVARKEGRKEGRKKGRKEERKEAMNQGRTVRTVRRILAKPGIEVQYERSQ